MMRAATALSVIGLLLTALVSAATAAPGDFSALAQGGNRRQ